MCIWWRWWHHLSCWWSSVWGMFVFVPALDPRAKVPSNHGDGRDRLCQEQYEQVQPTVRLWYLLEYAPDCSTRTPWAFSNDYCSLSEWTHSYDLLQHVALRCNQRMSRNQVHPSFRISTIHIPARLFGSSMLAVDRDCWYKLLHAATCVTQVSLTMYWSLT